jgi:hypothetical protein
MKTLARSRSMALFSDAYQAGYRAAVDTSTPVLEPETATAPETDVFAAAAALGAWFEANEASKVCDRDKRRARKLIDTLAAGVYGGWVLRWKPSVRMTPDLEAIAETYRRLGLGEVPMRQCADSLGVEKA